MMVLGVCGGPMGGSGMRVSGKMGRLMGRMWKCIIAMGW
jgi:hypothetical protein